MESRKIVTTIGLGSLLILACNLGQAVANVGEQVADIERGSGNVVEETRPVESFDAIDLTGVGQVIIDFGSEEALRIEGEDNLIQYVETRVRGGTLEIGNRENVSIIPTELLRIYVTAVDLDSITVSGAGEIRAERVESPVFKITLSGLGNIDIEELIADELDVELGGSGNISIHGGEVANQNVSLTGLGNYDAGDLASQTASVDLGGAGNATVWVTDSLDATLSGLGNVSYYGSPQVNLNRTGLGNINSLGSK